MARAFSDEDSLRRTVDRLGPVADTLAQAPRATVEPGAPRRDSAASRAIAALTKLGGQSAPLAFERTLGEGGMGIVHLATQAALGRKVAVKTLKAEHKSEVATMRLLREAWVTGALEHPNVVPVYDVALDDSGSPVIVLKRIEGEEWGSLMRDDARVRERFGVRGLLDWNLSIFMQVCNAIHFAHSRGIVHRDLKPENVMIGTFGEVYVVDWGIAVSLKDDGDGRLPLAKDATEMAGTLAYMAPEMLGGVTNGVTITERSDVYLLGAVLYEIVTGRPPHDGKSLMDMVRSIAQSRPSFPDLAPEELVVICQRAMDPDPDARFENAEQLRLAVQGFLQHRGARAIAQEAEQQLDDLREQLARTDRDRDALYNLFGAVRFGFHSALRAWKENEAARIGLREATLLMIEVELSERDGRAAASLLATLDDPPPDLPARIAKARAEQEETQRVASEFDANTGRRTRTFLALVVGTFWTLAPLPMLVWPRAVGPGSIAIVAVVFAMVGAGLGLWARETMWKTAYNRRIAATVQTLPLITLVLCVIAWMLRIPTDTVLVLTLFLWFVVSGLAAIHIERRMWLPTVGYLVATLFSAWRTRWVAYAMSGANFDLMLTLYFAWRVESLVETVHRARDRVARASQRPG